MEGWPKKLTVDKRIIGTLSRSTYDNFPQSLKELIVNSYDADSTKVEIIIDAEKEVITIKDNGKGMSESDFEFYLRIAGKSRKKEQYTEGNRRIVGKFGVGFLAVFPFCKIYKIETTKKGSTAVVSASIDCEKYFQFDDNTIASVDSVPIFGGTVINGASIGESFTTISLIGFTKELQAFFKSEYKLNKRGSIKGYPPIQLIKWTLAEYLPISYREENLNSIFHLKNILPFTVTINGDILYRNNNIGQILETHTGDAEEIGGIKFRYVIGTQFQAIQPPEARYIFLRNFNVGVGDRDTFGIGLDGRLYAKLAWISIDVDIIEGLNDLISVSRDKFNFSPDYEQFKDFFRGKLRLWADNLNDLTNLRKLIEIKDSKQVVKFDSEIENEKEKIVTSLRKKGLEIEVTHREDFIFGSQPKKEPFSVVEKTDGDNLETRVVTKIQISTSDDSSLPFLRINGIKYFLEYGDWNNDMLFPVCKISESKILINRKSKILEDNKLRDSFIKFFAIIAINYTEGIINREVAVKFNNQIFQTFE